MTWRWVTPEYFHLLEIPMLRGSGFKAEQRSSAQHFVVLSKTLATRLFLSEDPIGRQMRLANGAPEEDNPVYTVSGVAADVKNGGLAAGNEPEYYRLRRDAPEDWERSATYLMKTALPSKDAEPWIRSRVAAVDPTVPVRIESLSSTVGQLADQPRFETLLVGLFAAIGLLLAAVGLFGVIAFLVAQRTQEVGVRMALGATRSDILLLFVRGGLRMIVPGVLLGAAAAIVLSRFLESQLFGVSPHDPVTIGAAMGLLMLIAAVATVLPARAAMKVEPATALRAE